MKKPFVASIAQAFTDEGRKHARLCDSKQAPHFQQAGGRNISRQAAEVLARRRQKLAGRQLVGAEHHVDDARQVLDPERFRQPPVIT